MFSLLSGPLQLKKKNLFLNFNGHMKKLFTFLLCTIDNANIFQTKHKISSSKINHV